MVALQRVLQHTELAEPFRTLLILLALRRLKLGCGGGRWRNRRIDHLMLPWKQAIFFISICKYYLAQFLILSLFDHFWTAQFLHSMLSRHVILPNSFLYFLFCFWLNSLLQCLQILLKEIQLIVARCFFELFFTPPYINLSEVLSDLLYGTGQMAHWLEQAQIGMLTLPIQQLSQHDRFEPSQGSCVWFFCNLIFWRGSGLLEWMTVLIPALRIVFQKERLWLDLVECNQIFLQITTCIVFGRVRGFAWHEQLYTVFQTATALVFIRHFFFLGASMLLKFLPFFSILRGASTEVPQLCSTMSHDGVAHTTLFVYHSRQSFWTVWEKLVLEKVVICLIDHSLQFCSLIHYRRRCFSSRIIRCYHMQEVHWERFHRRCLRCAIELIELWGVHYRFIAFVF